MPVTTLVEDKINVELNIPDRMGFHRKRSVVIDKEMYKTAMTREKLLAKYGVYEITATSLSENKETQTFMDAKMATLFAQRNSNTGHAFVAIHPRNNDIDELIIIHAYKNGRLLTYNKVIETFCGVSK